MKKPILINKTGEDSSTYGREFDESMFGGKRDK